MVLFQFACTRSLADKCEPSLSLCHGTIGWLAGIKHGHSEVIKIGLGDTCEIGWLGNGSALHMIELEKCCDHHLVVKWQLDWLTSQHQVVQSINCLSSHQDESTIEFADSLG